MTNIYLVRYLISAARHHVSTLNKRHTLALELIKDSFNVSLPQENIELFTNNEAQDGGPYKASAIDDFQVELRETQKSR